MINAIFISCKYEIVIINKLKIDILEHKPWRVTNKS